MQAGAYLMRRAILDKAIAKEAAERVQYVVALSTFLPFVRINVVVQLQVVSLIKNNSPYSTVANNTWSIMNRSLHIENGHR